MKMSVMRYDGLQGQPFWMQNDQLANPSQYCLKTSARVESDRRKVHPRSLPVLNEDPLGPSRIMQMDDNAFNNDSVQDDVQGANKRRKSSSDGNTRRKLLRISGLDTEGRDMPRSSSPSSDDDESKCSDDDDGGRAVVDGHHYGANRMTILAGEQSGDVANNCDNEELDDDEMETGNEIDKDYDVVDEDDVTNNAEERCVDSVEERNNGDDNNLDEDEDFDDEFEPDGRAARPVVFAGSEKVLNSEDDSSSLPERIVKPDGVDTELASVVAERRGSVSNTLTRFNQVALETKTVNNSNATVANSSSESRRNKRKNFKPRNIVYQYEMCEDGENELNDEYQLALSNWEMSSQQKNSSRSSPAVGENSPVVQRTSSESLSEFCPKSSPHAAVDNDDYDRIRETGGDEDNEGPSGAGGGDFDQPLDLSDSASAVEPVKQENNLIFHKHHNRKKNARRYPGPSEVKGPSRSSQSITGSPMDLTTASRPDDDKISTKLCSRPNNSDSCDVIDLSKGQVHISSAYNAVPNYATSLTTVPSSSGSVSTATSTSVTVNSNSNNGNSSSYSHQSTSNNGGAGFRINSIAGRASSSLPKCTPSVTSTGISASLLDLVSAGGLAASPSKRNAKAAAAAAAAHAAAISLAQAVRDREDGHSEGGAGGMVGPAGLLSSLPPNMDASNMKEYAESTMKELLGLYGFNDMVESLTKDVPLPNMLSADVLESMSNTLGLLQSPASLFPSLLPRSVPTSSPSSKASTSVVTSICHSPPLSHHGKLSHGGGRLGQMNSTTTSPSPTNIAPSTSSHSHVKDDIYESLHSQVVGSMAKLANLPSGSIVGNPRNYLPPNMNTILRLAAMQKNKQTDVTSTSPSPTLPSANVPKQTVASSSRGRNSASGINSGIFQEQRKSAPIDYSRYVKRYVKMRLLRFSSSAECGNNSCKDLNYREHFHCLDCNSRVFIKKEEMIRHFKWHKKRDESLQHGFLRYSPMDDCSEKFPHCVHNRKQTHYHCLMYQDGCDKCYISTSDVQMHANYHRKDSAIIQEGFQRYRATEDCGLSICAFSGQRTTHFHCRRSGCNFTFKNKADMEKHKTYHIKDEQLNKDGFKKFMKHEGCSFESCRFSRVCNHIHCIRPGCTYVLHSSGQLYSHKRKHERRDNEMAYRKFKLAQSMMRSLGDNQGLPIGDEMKHGGDSLPPPVSSPGPSVCSPSSSSGLPSSALSSSASGFTAENAYNEVLHQSFSKYSAMLEAGGNLPLDSPVLPYGMVPGADPFSLIEFGADFLKGRSDDSWRKYLSRFTANDPCKTNCDLIYKDHYHCNAENCTMAFKSKDDVREHARNHELQDQITEAFYTTIDGGLPGNCPGDCPYQNKQRHYHCGWQSCREIILSVDKPFRRLDHYKMHEYTHKLNFSKEPVPLNITSCSSIDGIFRRKRGRPPKNRTVEFPVTSGSSEYPQAIYTSFKLPKLNHLPIPMSNDGCLTSPVGSMGAITPPVSKNSPSPGAQSILAGHLSPSITHPSKAFPKLSHLQPHIQKHLGPSASSTETTKGTAADDCSEDGFSDRQMDDDDDDQDADGHMNSRHHNPDTSDDSDSSSNRFTTNYRHSSPSADSTPSSHNQSYGPFISNAVAVNHMNNDLLHTFPNVADQLHINPLANFFNPSGAANVGPPQDLSCHNQSSGPPHPNGSSGSSHLEMNVGEQSSPVSTPPGAPSSLESYGSSPSSPRLQFVNQKHYPSGGANQMDGGGHPRENEYTEGKKGKMTGLRLLRDEPVPEGYLRYRFNEDCRYTHCGYREHQTHFHCMRKDCGYSFCDKTRFVQHTARHERLDTLMGGDFQQFRAQVPCGRSECVYVTAPGNLANKASHFHCLKCEFVCTDTNKVVAHRRQHQKLDSITAAGFEKYTAQQSCNNDGCSHNQRQTHYHCVKCQYAVLGLSQMSAHKYRHLEG